MSAPLYDLLVAGEVNPDLIVDDPDLQVRFGQEETLVQDAHLAIGSSSAIFACGAARLGLRVAFVGVTGEDLFGRFMLDALEARNVDTRYAIVEPGLKTGLSVILNRGQDRAILTHLGAIAALHTGHLPDALLAKARHLHVASYFLQRALQPGLPGLFRRAHALGLTTSLDTNWDPTARWGGVLELLPMTDVFFPNAREALAISGMDTVEDAARWLARRSGAVVVKLGGEGGLVQRGEETARAAALSLPVVDTVGAGDSFDAGFIFGVLRGWSLQESLELACICGSLSVRAAGGTAAQPGLEEALAWRRKK